MKRAWVKLMLVFPVLIVGCKGFWDAPPSTGNGTGSSGGDFYVMNVATQQIAGYTITSGAPVALPGSPVDLGITPLSIAVSPSAGFLYVGTDNGIYVYSISSTGQLTIANNSKPISTDKAVSMQVSPDDDWLIDVQAAANFAYAIPLDASTGLPTSTVESTATLPAATSNTPQVAVSPDGSYVFVAIGSEGTAAIPFTTANASPFGAVTRIATVNTAGSALSVAVDPVQSGQTTPRLFYIGESAAVSGSNSGGLRAFQFSTLGGTLKELTGSPFAISGLAPYSILPISTGNYVYVVNRQVSGSNTGVIAGFSIAASSSTYTLTALGSTFTVGTNPVGLAEDSTGTYVLAVNFGGSPDLKGYTFDATNAGYLDSVSALSISTGTDPVQASAIAAVP